MRRAEPMSPNSAGPSGKRARTMSPKQCLNCGAADESFCGAVLLTLGRADEVVVLAMIDEPILDVGARLRQPLCRNGILNANHSSLIQLVGDFLWVAIFNRRRCHWLRSTSDLEEWRACWSIV